MKKAKFDDKMAKFESGAAFQKPAKNDTSVGAVASLAPAPEPRRSPLPSPEREEGGWRGKKTKERKTRGPANQKVHIDRFERRFNSIGV